MAHLLRVIVLLLSAVASSAAFAVACTGAVSDANTWATQCAAEQAYAAASNGWWTYSLSSCQVSTPVLPSCKRVNGSGYVGFNLGFSGSCPAAGSPGPSFSGEFSSAGPPETSCSGPCRVQNSGVEVCIPRPDGSQYCAGQTAHTGETCVPTPAEPNVPTPPVDCPSGAEINGDCLTVQDMDGDPSPSSPHVSPGICIGTTCNEIPPNPNASADCVSNPTAAVCVGNANSAGSPPRPPDPPRPPSQPPVHSTTAATSAGPVRVDIYGPPYNNTSGPPDESGNCPGGTSLAGNLCTCPTGDVWNGAACVAEDVPGDCPESDPDYPNCEGGGRTAGTGHCGPGGAPACSGDEIDCSIVRQTWETRCALLGTEEPGEVDLVADPLGAYGGADALFSDDGDIGPGSLDADGWLGSGSCPTIAPIQVLGTSVSIPAVWCELSWLGTLLVSLAYLIALRIVYGE